LLETLACAVLSYRTVAQHWLDYGRDPAGAVSQVGRQIVMQFPKQLAQLAQQQALAGFATLTEHMLVDAEASMAHAMRSASAEEQVALSGARSLVRYEGQALRARLQQHFDALLERAMQTMHTDLRAGLRAVSIDELSLMDDSVMDRQILVDRLLVRLRDVDQLSLGRLNVIIAQLHGVSEVRERENPFRPWLLARALYEAVSSMVQEATRIRVLFQHLSAAMAAHLHDYYGAVLDVFERRGVVGHLGVRASELTRAERERLAWKRAAEESTRQSAVVGAASNSGNSGNSDNSGDSGASGAGAAPRTAGVLAALRQMMSGARMASPVSAFPDLDGFDEAQELRTLVRALGAGRRTTAPAPASASQHQAPGAALAEALRRAQLMALEGGGDSAPLRLARQLEPVAGERGARQRIGLVALLFEFMLEDGLLDAAARTQLGRLFVPFLRVALETPALPVQADHAARRLVERFGQVAAVGDAAAARHAADAGLLERTVDDVLRRFDGDPALLDEARRTLDQAVAGALLATDERHAACVAAIAEAESAQLRVAAAEAALEPLLALRTDARIVDFIRTVWTRVLARSAPDAAGHDQLLAELVWSAQAKLDLAEHGALMRMLPGLVKRVREGLALLGLLEAETKAALDQLVAVHMDVMANRQPPIPGALGLDALRRHFAPLAHGMSAAPDAPDLPNALNAPAWLRAADLAPLLARQGVVAEIHEAVPGSTPARGEGDALAQFQPGMGVEFLEGGVYVSARLVARGAAGGAFLFSVPGRDKPQIVLRAALLAWLRGDTLRTLEYAPLFERAIERLTVSADALAA